MHRHHSMISRLSSSQNMRLPTEIVVYISSREMVLRWWELSGLSRSIDSSFPRDSNPFFHYINATILSCPSHPSTTQRKAVKTSMLSSFPPICGLVPITLVKDVSHRVVSSRLFHERDEARSGALLVSSEWPLFIGALRP